MGKAAINRDRVSSFGSAIPLPKQAHHAAGTSQVRGFGSLGRLPALRVRRIGRQGRSETTRRSSLQCVGGRRPLSQVSFAGKEGPATLPSQSSAHQQGEKAWDSPYPLTRNPKAAHPDRRLPPISTHSGSQRHSPQVPKGLTQTPASACRTSKIRST